MNGLRVSGIVFRSDCLMSQSLCAIFTQPLLVSIINLTGVMVAFGLIASRARYLRTREPLWTVCYTWN